MANQENSPNPGWGRSTGMIDLGNEALRVDSSDEAVERANILQAVNRYGLAYDERDLDALACAFTVEGVWEGNVGGGFVIEPLKGRNAIASWLRGFMDLQTDQRRHNILNHVVLSQKAHSARVVTYLLLTSATNGEVKVVTTGFYTIDLLRDDKGAWLIDRLVAGFDAPF